MNELKIIRVGRWFPNFWTGGAIAAACFKWCIVWEKRWDAMSSHRQVALYEHELVHSRQQFAQPILWFLKYIFIPKQRALYEIEAIVVQIHFLLHTRTNKQLWLGIYAEDFARFLSGATYLWPCKKEWAYEEIIKQYKNKFGE